MNAASIRSNSGPQVGTFLSNWASNSRALHFALVVDDNACIVFKVDEGTILPAEWLALSDDNCRHDLLTELRLTLLDCCNKHVTATSSWEPVQPTPDTANRDNE